MRRDARKNKNHIREPPKRSFLVGSSIKHSEHRPQIPVLQDPTCRNDRLRRRRTAAAERDAEKVTQNAVPAGSFGERKRRGGDKIHNWTVFPRLRPGKLAQELPETHVTGVLV